MEDKHIIEHQQHVIDTDAGYRMQAIASDAALSHFRLTLSKLVAAEQEAEAARAPAEKEPLRPHELLLRFWALRRLTSTMPAATPPSASTSRSVSGSCSRATPKTSANTGVRNVKEAICVAG